MTVDEFFSSQIAPVLLQRRENYVVLSGNTVVVLPKKDKFQKDLIQTIQYIGVVWNRIHRSFDIQWIPYDNDNNNTTNNNNIDDDDDDDGDGGGDAMVAAKKKTKTKNASRAS